MYTFRLAPARGRYPGTDDSKLSGLEFVIGHAVESSFNRTRLFCPWSGIDLMWGSSVYANRKSVNGIAWLLRFAERDGNPTKMRTG